MTIVAIGADAAGYSLKGKVINLVRDLGHEALDVGTHGPEPMVDYPEYAVKVGEMVRSGRADFGILICGTGIGMSIAANKIPGIRAALCHNPFGARKSREHNDANVLALGAWEITTERAAEIVELWLTTDYHGGRHESRLRTIAELERPRE